MTLSFKKPIILTRTNQDNKDFVNLFLSTYKLENIKNCFKCLPLIEIVLEKKTKETIGSNPLIFTSRHGVQAISLMSNLAEKEIFCVGQSTANLAIELGLKNVFYPSVGTVSNLVRLIRSKVDNNSSSLHYFRGEEISYDLKGELSKFGYVITESIVYRQKQIRSERLINNIISKENAGGVVFFSASVAKIFCKGIKIVPEDFLFMCISDRVAQVVFEAQLKGNYKVKIASQPTTEEIIELIYNEKSIWPN